MPVRFGSFVLDPDTRELIRGGVPVSLSPKAFDLLCLLVTHRPKAMAKSDLLDRLWPDTFVVEKNLANLVGEIRDALGDDSSNSQFIRTVHRFGYAFRDVALELGTTRTARVSGGELLHAIHGLRPFGRTHPCRQGRAVGCGDQSLTIAPLRTRGALCGG